MNKSIASLTLAFAFASAAIAEPAISALSVTQNSSRVVTIDFTLSETAILTLDLMTNGVSIGAQNYRLMHDAESDSMDYPANKVVPAGRHVFMWRAREDWPDHVFTNGEFAVELKAWSFSSPPDYMVVDLTTKSNRWFYASAADLPRAASRRPTRMTPTPWRNLPTTSTARPSSSCAASPPQATNGAWARPRRRPATAMTGKLSTT